MNKREWIVLLLLALVLAIVTFAGFIRKHQINNSFNAVITETSIKISINSASPADLERLPGIGPVLAGRIVAYRKKHGDFDALEDIKVVKGIGNKLFQKILPYIKL